jgi:hypothetical protein
MRWRNTAQGSKAAISAQVLRVPTSTWHITSFAGSAANSFPAPAKPRTEDLQSHLGNSVTRFLLAGAYPSFMSTAPNLRRSTRVPIMVAIEVEGCSEPLICEGVTIVVNLHGALISTDLALSVGMKISIHVILTDKHAKARVIYVDPKNGLRCGIELDEPRNIWGIPLHPEDWDERGHRVDS